MIPNPAALLPIFFIMLLLMLVSFLALYLMSNWQEIKLTRKANCLIWRHPDNLGDRISQLELVNIKNPPGPYWPYRSFFFLSEKQIKWCWEEKRVEKSGEVTYVIEPFLPDNHIDYGGVTTSELADALDWRSAKRLLQPKAPLLQKVAQGGVIIMGCAALFGIMALLDMLGKGG